MRHKKENTDIGNEIERLYCSLIKKNDSIIAKIKNKFNIKHNILEIHPTGPNLKKSDVLMLFDNNYSLGVNIKAGKSNFNQVTRLWLEKFANDINLSVSTKKAIQESIDNHRLKRSKIFIDDCNRQIIQKEFEKKSKLIMDLIFRGINNEIVKILALYDRTKKEFFLYDMNEVVINLCKLNISFSKRGVLYFGDFITMQRKGGNGKHIQIPKSDSQHPGNQIQFKMRILSFMKYNQPFAILK